MNADLNTVTYIKFLSDTKKKVTLFSKLRIIIADEQTKMVYVHKSFAPTP